MFYHAPWELQPAIRIDVDGVAGRRIDPALEPHAVRLWDIRQLRSPLAFETDGVTFVHASSDTARLARPEASLRAYEEELETLVTEHLDAMEVVVFDHTIRADGSDVRPPARHAHGDYSTTSARQRLTDVLGAPRAQLWAQGHFGIVNAWRPLKRVERTPLAFARPSTVSEHDWIDVDLLYPDRRGQIVGLLPSTTHQWMYMPDMTPDQVALFRVHDSRGRAPVAHSAVDLDETPDDAPRRQSIESRLLVRFA